jgi:hypothetical protein
MHGAALDLQHQLLLPAMGQVAPDLVQRAPRRLVEWPEINGVSGQPVLPVVGHRLQLIDLQLSLPAAR